MFRDHSASYSSADVTTWQLFKLRMLFHSTYKLNIVFWCKLIAANSSEPHISGTALCLCVVYACLLACLFACLYGPTPLLQLFGEFQDLLFPVSVTCSTLIHTLVCLLACLLVCLFACLLVCLFACLLACLFAWLLACLFACLLVCLERPHHCSSLVSSLNWWIVWRQFANIYHPARNSIQPHKFDTPHWTGEENLQPFLFALPVNTCRHLSAY